jgi:hypothetical protein
MNAENRFSLFHFLTAVAAAVPIGSIPPAPAHRIRASVFRILLGTWIALVIELGHQPEVPW